MSDGASLEDVVRQRGPALLAYAYVLTGDHAEAEDLVQEALLRVFGALGRPLPTNAAHTYVKRAISTTFIDRSRKRKARPQIADGVAADKAVVDHADAVTTAQAIHAAVLTLPPRERACVVLRYLEEMSTSAVANELGIAPGTVKRYLADGLARLRDLHPELIFDDVAPSVPVHGTPKEGS